MPDAFRRVPRRSQWLACGIGRVAGLLLHLLVVMICWSTVCLTVTVVHAAHRCIHEQMAQKFAQSVDMRRLVVEQNFASSAQEFREVMPDVLLQPQHAEMDRNRSTTVRLLKSSAASSASFQPIRIAFDLSKLDSDPGYMCTFADEEVDVDGQTFYCSEDDVLTPDKKQFITSVLLDAIHTHFNQIISVQQIAGNLIVSGIDCGDGSDWACCKGAFPSNYATIGVPNADYLLHVTARPTTGSTIAWALPCNIDQYGRPISGHANFGPALLDTSSVSRIEQIGTGLHEMTHALVFSQSRFYDFRQPLNGPLWGLNNVVSQKYTNGIYVSKIITPNVVKQVKQQFNCYNWVDAGAELENGDSGSADFTSHWEKRLFANEYMTATSPYDPVYSAITLALFEDSGWYHVSYKQAEILPWGYLEGCGFVTSKCSEWSDRYVCNDEDQSSCTADYNAKGYCNIAEYQSSVPSAFQYFSDPKLAGRDTYADYCPFFRAYSNGDCRNIGSSPTIIDSDSLEEAGSNSKCFLGTLSKSKSYSSMQSLCYKVIGCDKTSLKLSIGSKEVDCPMDGADISVPGMKGVLRCPPAARLCQIIDNKCSGNGVLLPSGTCTCNSGFTGDDCSQHECPKNSNGEECSGDSHGSCDRTTGLCSCTSAYTGVACSQIICPGLEDKKMAKECSGHGTCNHDYGTCSCDTGYNGKACECVPGCTTKSCTSNGVCDCTTGACACSAGYYGLDCTLKGTPPVVTLQEDAAPIVDTIKDKEYKFYRVMLSSSSYDVTFVLRYDNTTGVDADLFGSFVDQLPTSQTQKLRLFSSNLAGSRDEINLCGNLGVFPRSLNNSFRYCTSPTTAYVQETPNYFYLSVLGFSGGKFNLSVETDRCANITCSGHGACGKNYPGICTCDRRWSGDDCSIPKCGPDCQDLGTCTDATVDASSSNALRNISSCYGNGECIIDGGAPRCQCDDTHLFTNPTADQALCKQLIASVASVQHFTEPFSIDTRSSAVSNLQLEATQWALYTLQVKDSWQVLVVNLQVATSTADAMLFVRKTKMPSVNLTQTATPMQFMDTDAWTSGSISHKIVLTRASSTLSSGLFYIGVYNSPYARADLGYQLNVNVSADCSVNDFYGICDRNGTSSCHAMSTEVCACAQGFAGDFCELQATQATVAASKPFNASMLSLSEGDWKYFSIEVDDSSVVLLECIMDFYRDEEQTTPVLPLLLHRGPNDAGFPSLSIESQFDYEGIAAGSSRQRILIPVDKACSFANDHKHCYKIAVYNRKYSGDVLRFNLTLRALTSRQELFPLDSCASNDANLRNCLGHGTCLDADASTSSSTSVQCKCANGWTGARCNTPKAFDLPQLWAAIQSISLLCGTCSTSFRLERGNLRIFRVPDTLRENTGLRILVRAASDSGTTASGGVNPSIYVSEVLPRSIYDFTKISVAVGAQQVVTLPNASFSGHFWVAVYSDYPLSEAVELNSSSSQKALAPAATKGLRDRVLLAEEASASASSSVTFQLSSEVFGVKGDSSTLLTSRSFVQVVFKWLGQTAMGVIVLLFGIALMLLVLFFCCWRIWRAPEHRDDLIKRHFNTVEVPNVQPEHHQQPQEEAPKPRTSLPVFEPQMNQVAIQQVHLQRVSLQSPSATSRASASAAAGYPGLMGLNSPKYLSEA